MITRVISIIAAILIVGAIDLMLIDVIYNVYIGQDVIIEKAVFITLSTGAIFLTIFFVLHLFKQD